MLEQTQTSSKSLQPCTIQASQKRCAASGVLAMLAALGALLLLPACSQAPTPPISIGINAFPSYELLYLADQKGFYRDEGVAVRIVEFASLSGEMALIRGEIDALVTYAPYAQRLMQKPGIHSIFDSSAIPGEVLDVLAFSAAMLAQRQEDVRRILRAYQRAQAFLREHPEQALAIMAKREQSEVQAFRATLENGLHILTVGDQAAYFETGGGLDQQLPRALAYLQQAGLLKEAPDPRLLRVDAAWLAIARSTER